MKTKLMPTQVEDVEQMLLGMEIPNFSEPGTGKTLTTIGFIDAMRFNSGLIICPVIALSMWKAVLEYELGCKVQIVKDSQVKINPLADFHVMSYGISTNRHSEWMENVRDVIVCDESHYIKSPDAARTQAIVGPDCSGDGGLYETCDQLLPLTGTPIERYADDLWSQLRAIQPEALAKHGALELRAFQRQFCYMQDKDYGGHQVRVSTGNQQEKKLNRMLYRDIGVIRRVMDDVAENMPPVSERTVSVQVTLSPEYVKAIALLPKNFEDLLEKGDAHIATARRLVGLSKVEQGYDYIEAEAKRDQLLVGFWHTEVGHALLMKARASGLRSAILTGETSFERREMLKQAFIAGEIDVLFGQIAAMGVALDGLQRVGRRVMFFEDEFAPSKVEQFYKRIWRLGQTSPVLVEYIKAIDDPLDDAIERLRKRKESGARRILAQGE